MQALKRAKTVCSRIKSLHKIPLASTDVRLSSDIFREFGFRKILSGQLSLEGDFHILLKGRKAMLSGSRGPAVAEKRLPRKKNTSNYKVEIYLCTGTKLLPSDPS